MSPQSPSNPSTTTETAESGKTPASGFGANEWLVDEIYQQYLQDPNSVDRAWWDFFADYKPVDGRMLPHRIDVHYGDKKYGNLVVTKYTLGKK